MVITNDASAFFIASFIIQIQSQICEK